MNKKRILLFLVIIVLFLYLGLDIVVPGYVEKQITREIKNNYKNSRNIKVNVNSFPPWELLFSMADEIKIEADILEYQDMVLKDVSAYYENILIDSGEIKGNNTDLKILITETELNNYIQEKYSDFKNFNIHLEKDNLFMKGTVNIFDSEINLEVEGDFEIKQENQVLFMPGEIKIEKLKISKEVINRFIKETGYLFDLSNLSFPVKISDIEVEENRLYLLKGMFAERDGGE